MLAYRCGRKLADITSAPRNMADLAYQVVSNATRRGWLNELIWAMKEDNPDSEIVSSIEDVEIVTRDIGGVSEQLNNLAKQVFELRAALFGVQGMDVGVLSELKEIHNDIEKMRADVQRIDETLKGLGETIPKGLGDNSLRILGYSVVGVTVLSMVITLIGQLGFFGA